MTDTPIVLTAGSLADLNADIATANGAGSGAYEIDLTANIQLSSASGGVTQIALNGATLAINGANGSNPNFTLDGGSAQQGLYVYSGAVTIENLTIAHAVAQGGTGSAGLGGGLFVGAAGAVTLNGVGFSGDKAIGATGGDGTSTGGGGGGKEFELGGSQPLAKAGRAASAAAQGAVVARAAI